MSREKYNQVIDDVHQNYIKETMFSSDPKWLESVPVMDMRTGEKSMGVRQYHKNSFVNMCKTNVDFSNTWGLKIEQRELSENEINDLKLKLILDYLIKTNIITVSFEALKNDEDNIPNIDWRREAWDMIGWIDYGREGDRDKLKEVYADIKNIPTKLITLTYNNERIESYE